MKMNKLLVLTFLIVVASSSSMAAIASLDIVNSFPHDTIKEDGVVVVARLESDSTTSTTATATITKPNGSTADFGSREVTVKSGNPREIAFQIGGEEINQYGVYTIEVSESNSGLSDSINNEVTPNPSVSASVPDLVYVNEEVEDAHIVVRTQFGSAIDKDNIVPGKLQVYEINDDSETDKVEKALVDTTDLTYDLSTMNLESSIPINQYEVGDHEIVGRFNISSCTSCINYTSVATSNFLVRKGFDRLTYSTKWGDLNSSDINGNVVTVNDNVGSLENDVKDVDDGIESSIAANSPPRTLGITHTTLNTVLLLFMMFVIVVGALYS